MNQYEKKQNRYDILPYSAVNLSVFYFVNKIQYVTKL